MSIDRGTNVATCPDCGSSNLDLLTYSGAHVIWGCKDCTVRHSFATPADVPPDVAAPRFKAGDEVTAPNGEPRVVTGVCWAPASISPLSNHDASWGWLLTTVHPDDPRCVGQGFESNYRPREGL